MPAKRAVAYDLLAVISFLIEDQLYQDNAGPIFMIFHQIIGI